MEQCSINWCFCCAAFPLSGLDLSENGRYAGSDIMELSVNGCSFVFFLLSVILFLVFDQEKLLHNKKKNTLTLD